MHWQMNNKSLREHINAEKKELLGLSEKELMVRAVMALGGYGGRLDRIEAQSRRLLQDVCTEMKVILENESRTILERFHGDIDTLRREVKSAENEIRTTRVTAIDGFKAEVSTLKADIQTVGEETVRAIEEAGIESLSEELETIRFDVQEIKNSIDDPYHSSGLRERVNSISDDIDSIQSTIDDIESEIDSMKSDVSDIKNSVTDSYSYNGLYEKVNSIGSEIEDIKSDISSIRYDISDIKSSS